MPKDDDLYDELWNRMTPEAQARHSQRLAVISYAKLIVPILATILFIFTPLAKSYFDHQNKERDIRLEEQKLESSRAINNSQSALQGLTAVSEQLGQIKSENQILQREVEKLKNQVKELTQENAVALAERNRILQKVRNTLIKYPELESVFAEELN